MYMAKKKINQALTSQDIRDLKNKLHQLKPAVVINSKVLHDGVFQEIDSALNNSELIKIRTHATSGEELVKIGKEICENLGAVLIQTIGYIIAIYRKNEVNEVTGLDAGN